jgi:hypothetical protein
VAYLLLAYFFLNGKVSLVMPSAALAVAICFNAEAGQLLNLLFLLFASVLVVVPPIAFSRMARGPWGVFLIIASAFMLLHMLVWRARLGLFHDWNQFAPGIIPLALLCFHNLLRSEKLAHARWI